MPIIQAKISIEEHEEFIKLLNGKTQSEFIRNAVFNRREKTIKELPPIAQLTSNSELSNEFSGIIEAYRRGEDVLLDMLEHQKKLNTNLAF